MILYIFNGSNNSMNPILQTKFRAIISTSLILVYLTVFISGILLFVLNPPAGSPMRVIHTYAGILMGLIIPVHLYINWGMYMGEVRMLFKK